MVQRDSMLLHDISQPQVPPVLETQLGMNNEESKHS